MSLWWIIGVVALFLLALVLLSFVLNLRNAPAEHEDLQEFRNRQQRPRWLDTLEQERRNGQHQHHDSEANIVSQQRRAREMIHSRVALVKSHLYSHTLQPGESARNLAAAMIEKSPEKKSIRSSDSDQPLHGIFAHVWCGFETSVRTSVRSMKASVRSVISMSKPECSICLQQYQEGETISWAKDENCNHMYHQECIVQWLDNHDDCPLCRTKLLVGNYSEE